MRVCVLSLALVLCALLAGPLGASQIDGIVLKVSRDPAPGGVLLQWSGGQPDFTIYRSTDPAQVVAPGNAIGISSARIWSDVPPAATILYYEIRSPCVYAPPEVCDGLDNDCNGTVDEPGSELSCALPNAVAACVDGSCAVAQCHESFGDCNLAPADGCENDLTASPDCGACDNDCDLGLGGCAHSLCVDRTCAPPFDATRCAAPPGATTGGAAHCAFAAAGCASAVDSDNDGLGDVWEDNDAIDYDCDGDYDSNDVLLPEADPRVKDVYLKIAWMAPSPSPYPTPDLSQPGCPITTITEPSQGHKPEQDSVDFVVRAFSGAHLTPAAQPCGKAGDAPCAASYACVDFACLPSCNVDADCASTCNGDCLDQGGARCVAGPGPAGGVCRLWRLHVDPLPAAGVPHHDIVSLGEISDACANTEGGGSMTPGDHVNFYDIKATVFDPKEAAFKHFLLFGHDNTCYGTGSPGCGDISCPLVGGEPPQTGTSGVAEVRGNDSIVSLALLQLQSPSQDRARREAGALMHELGHNLGLDHSGPVPEPHDVSKVNYLSSMNPIYQFTGIIFTDVPGSIVPVSAHPDYSHRPLDLVLDETSLSEPVGVGFPGLQEPNTKALIRYSADASPVCPCPIDPCTGLPFPRCFHLGAGNGAPIDWNCDGTIAPATVAADINGNGTTRDRHDSGGAADWVSLFYEFQCQSTYINSAEVSP